MPFFGDDDTAKLLPLLKQMEESFKLALEEKKEMTLRFSEINGKLDVTNNEISHLKEAIVALSKIVRDGNGQPSHQHRITIMEEKQKTLESQLTAKNSIERKSAVKEKESAKNKKYDLAKTLITTAGPIIIAGLALAGQILQYILSGP